MADKWRADRSPKGGYNIRLGGNGAACRVQVEDSKIVVTVYRNHANVENTVATIIRALSQGITL